MIRPHPRPVRFLQATLPAFATLLGILAAPSAARADEADTAALLTFEGQAALRDRLSERLLLMSAAPAAGEHEDASWVVWQHGEAVRTLWDGKIRVLTSQVLAEGAGRLEASRVGGGVVGPAHVTELIADLGLALLDCPACAKEKAAPLAPTDACESGRYLFFVVPAGDNAVITHTLMGGPAESPLEKLRLVPGALPQGTPLFDASARVAAIAVRTLPGTNRTLVAPLCPVPPPPAAEKPSERTPSPDTRQAP